MTAVFQDMRGHHGRTYVLATAIVMFNIADAFVTRALMDRGGIEANPLMQPVVDTWVFWPVKVLVPALVVLACLWRGHRLRTLRWFWVVAAIYGVVVVWNTSLFFWRYGP